MSRAIRFLCIVVLLVFAFGGKCDGHLMESLSGMWYDGTRLVVVISVDGLQPYDIENYMSSLGNEGFRWIVDHASYKSESEELMYNNRSVSAYYATFMSGRMPCEHGITGEKLYSLLDGDVISCIEDARYGGIGTAETVSPRLLEVRTIADDVKERYPFSKIYAIAKRANSAVMLGGHLATGAVWLNDEGRWCTSKYYEKGLPLWSVEADSNSYVKGMVGRQWTMKNPIRTYRYYAKGFRTWNNDYPVIKELKTVEDVINCPVINDFITETAIRAIREDRLGTEAMIDMLMIEYSIIYPGYDGGRCAETEDAMMRLDEGLKKLINAINISVGLNNAIIVLTAPPFEKHHTSFREKKPMKQFNGDRAMALLNSYLMALYGQGRWVERYYDGGIFLNHKLISDQGLMLRDVAQKVADFMTEFDAVLRATAAVERGGCDEFHIKMANSLYKQRTGDVVLSFESEDRRYVPLYIVHQ